MTVRNDYGYDLNIPVCT